MAYYPQGLGEPTGDPLVSQKSPIYHSGSVSVWYVDSNNGVDDSGEKGQERLQPLATLSQAHTNASAGDVIVLKDGHAESLTGITLSKDNLTIVGGGKSGSDPTVTFTPASGAGTPAITVSGDGIQLRNIKFAEPTAAQGNVILTSGDRFSMVDCLVELGGSSDDIGVELAAGAHRFKGCKFVSVATSLSEVPDYAVSFGSVNNVKVEMDGVIFDGGTVGFMGGQGYRGGSGTGNVLRAYDVSLLRGADMAVSDSDDVLIQVGTTSGSGRIVILTAL